MIAVAIALAGGSARAQPAPAPSPDDAAPAPAPVPAPAPAAPALAPAPAPAQPVIEDDEIGDQGVAVALGVAAGGRVTPGGLRIDGHYLYQLSATDWFDGASSFTFGSSAAACFRDRSNQTVCDHGIGDGSGFELAGAIRRVFVPQGAFRPFARVGLGIGLARFTDDDVAGFTVRLLAGGGLRVKLSPGVAILASGNLELGFGSFNHGLGAQPEVGLAITAGVEFRLR